MKLLVIFISIVVTSSAKNVKDVVRLSETMKTSHRPNLEKKVISPVSHYSNVPRDIQSKGAGFSLLPSTIGTVEGLLPITFISGSPLVNVVPGLQGTLSFVTSIEQQLQSNIQFRDSNKVQRLRILTPHKTKLPNSFTSQNPSQNSYNKVQTIPQNTMYSTKPSYIRNPPQNTRNTPQNTGNGNYWRNWQQAQLAKSTNPVSIIKNEQRYGDNGRYKYEYQLGDGTHVAQEGFLLNPNSNKESFGKKGFYSYPGTDGKIYTVTYLADDTGYHVAGDHLPKVAPVPPVNQAAINTKAVKMELELQ